MVSIDRVKAMVLSPRTEWPRVDAEPGDTTTLFRDYLVWIAAIPAIATFIGFSIIGFGAFGVTVRMPFFGGLVNAVVSVALTLVMAFVLAKIAEVLAPRFGGRADFASALKLVVYGSTAALVSGAVYVLPFLAPLAILGALYSIYVVYLGVPVLMRTPADKALPFTAVLVLCGFVVGIVAGLLSAAITPSMPDHAAADIRIRTPQGEVSVDAGKLDGLAKQMEQAAKRMEEASKSGDPAAVGKAAAEALGAVAGATGGQGNRTPFGAQELKSTLPERLAGLPRTAYEAQSGAAAGLAGSTARADYGERGQRIEIEIVDMGNLSGLMSLAGWMGVTGERETGTEVERTYKEGTRMVHESRRKDGSRAEYKLVLGNGVMVQAEGHGIDLPALKRAVQELDLSRLESTRRPG